MKIKLYDTVLLKNGIEAVIVEILSDDTFVADIGSNPKNWDTIDVKINDIKKIQNRNTVNHKITNND